MCRVLLSPCPHQAVPRRSAFGKLANEFANVGMPGILCSHKGRLRSAFHGRHFATESPCYHDGSARSHQTPHRQGTALRGEINATVDQNAGQPWADRGGNDHDRGGEGTD